VSAAYCKGPNYLNLICSSYDPTNSRFPYKKNYFYKSTNTSNHIKCIAYISPSELYEKIWKKQNQLVETHYSNDSFEKTITKCMMSGSDGLRYRGKQTSTTDNVAKTSSTTIKFNDVIQYEKTNGQVITDLINKKESKSEDIIAWKLCSNASGEKRIVKLFIPADAQKVIPVGDDFLSTNFKERADQAIVMDIQQLDINTEKSVVPNETEAFSYIHSKKLSYKLGHPVLPDSFNSDPSAGCSNGIHYFRNRRAANIFFIILYNLYDLLWSTSRP
jgi:Family of unknown function (DUF5758)